MSAGTGVARRPGTGAAARPGLGRWPELLPVAATAAGWAYLVLAAPAPHAAHPSPVPTAGGVLDLAAMTVAMTGLLAVPGSRTAVFASPWWRARRAVTLFVAGFAGAWTAIVLGLNAAAAVLGWLVEPAAAGGALLAAGAAAQLHPRRELRTGACERPMRIRPYGPVADLDCTRFGALSAARCARLCALPMLAMLSLPASLPLTAALAALALAERVSGRRWRVPVALSYAALAVTVLA